MNGRCFPWEGLVSEGGCSYDECFADSGCGAGTPCICRSSATDNSANVCDVGGNCAVDSDCGKGGYCSPSVGGYFCHTVADLCVNDSDCPSPDAGTDTTSTCTSYTACAYSSQSIRWECTQVYECPP